MKKDPFYTLKTVSGTKRLLPFGQAVAELRPALRLNDGAARVWALLDDCDGRDELARRWLEEYEGSERGAARADLDGLLSELTALGALEPEAPAEPAAADLCVGPLTLRLCARPAYFSDDFARFLRPVDPQRPVRQTLTVTRTYPPTAAGLRCLLDSEELAVYEGADRFLLRFPTMPDITGVRLTPDGGEAVFYVRLGDAERLRGDLFHAVRHAFLLRAQRLGFFAMHAAAILYRERVWLFSAPSGTGKSTHAAHWLDRFGAKLLNGDLALLSVGRDGAVFHPMPWCGTSGVAENETHPLGGVVFLRRAEENAAALLPPEARQMRCANRLISPVWTEALLEENLAFAGLLAGRVPMWELGCTPAPESAEVMRRAVDGWLKEAGAHG